MIPSVVQFLLCAACRVRVSPVCMAGVIYYSELDDHLTLLKKFISSFVCMRLWLFKLKRNATKLHFWRRQRLFNQTKCVVSTSSASVFHRIIVRGKRDLVSHGYQHKSNEQARPLIEGSEL